MSRLLSSLALTLLLATVLTGCDLAALLADPRVAQREADARAVGSACRYGMRSIEDCYELNDKASKSAVFAGWKEMDQYMRDNKVDGIPAKIAHSADEPVVEAKAKADTKADKVDKAEKGDKADKAKVADKAKSEKSPDKSTEKAEKADKSADKSAAAH